ncbi:uncharacterized protein LOC112975190 isoform X3 [Apteryx rowi]|uniref:uncharacterized protein LOC112975190 isoform X3 n=1 Tax=Apteryx rowi TaxID=308060 RepID=UPI000E1DF894|nr:uncharacterized protein LOC112975190 isoform X3 [Apteryx rowi]
MEGIREHKNGHRRNKFTPKSMPGDGGAVDQSAQEGPPSFSSSSVPHWVLCGMSGCGGMWGVPEAVQMFWCGQCDATEPVHVPRFLEVWDGRCGTQRGAWQALAGMRAPWTREQETQEEPYPQGSPGRPRPDKLGLQEMPNSRQLKRLEDFLLNKVTFTPGEGHSGQG